MFTLICGVAFDRRGNIIAIEYEDKYAVSLGVKGFIYTVAYTSRELTPFVLRHNASQMVGVTHCTAILSTKDWPAVFSPKEKLFQPLFPA
jgi:hypothetical protein